MIEGKSLNNKENKCIICDRLIGQFGDIEKDKCILHCEKDDWYIEDENGKRNWNKSELKIKKFWDEIRQHEEKFCTEVQFSRIVFPDLFREDMFPDIDFKKSFFSNFKESMKKKIVFRNCIFLNNIEYFVSNFEFSDCKFSQSVSFYCDYIYSKSLALKNCSRFHGECKIVNIIQGTVVKEKVVNININKCVFKFDVKIENLWISKLSIDNTSFEQSLTLNDCLIEEIDIKNKDKKMINKIVFENNEFCKKSDIYFENVDIGFLSFKKNLNDSEFMSFFNINISQGLEFINSNLSNFEFHNCNFSKAKIKIENVAFISNNGFTIFNDVKWPSCKEFSYIIVKDEEDNKILSLRDTFRQLKYVNEKQGNIIDANKFYSAEMKEYKKELKNEKWRTYWQDKIIFWLNEKVSNFSQNWILPLIWFFSIGAVAFYISNIDRAKHYIISSFDLTRFPIIIMPPIKKVLEEYISFINPFSISSENTNSMIWLVFKALSVFIIYQFIISLRRQTRR